MVIDSEAQSMTVSVNLTESPNKKFVYGEGQEVPLEHSTRNSKDVVTRFVKSIDIFDPSLEGEYG